MAEETEAPEAEEEKKPGMMGKLIVWVVIFVMGAGAGAAVPLLTGSGDAADNTTNPATLGIELMDFPEPGEEISFIEFDEVVANLNDPRASRFVTCTLSLQIAKTHEEAMTKLVEEKGALLKNWLIAHLRDKELEEVRGKYGHNMLRREIHGEFNHLLFTDGIERIQDVLFRDFKIQ